VKNVFAIFLGLFGFFYILNPTAGVIEFIPDNIPIIGNLDEASAVLLIVGCFRHFNIDLFKYFKK
jgi:hypothetical protein